MKHLLLTTIAAVVLVGCGPKPPDISIHEAVRKGNIEAVKQHLDSGTDVNLKGDQMKWTPLHWAAYWGHMEIAEILLSAGADVNAYNPSGAINEKDYNRGTPLNIATIQGHQVVANLLRKHGGFGGSEDSIWIAAQADDLEAFNKHLENGEDLDIEEDISGGTLLHKAASSNSFLVVKRLIQLGVDANPKDGRNRTPLDLAVTFGRDNTAEFLRNNGGKHETINVSEAVLSVAGRGDVKALKHYVEAGADVNTQDVDGETPLHYLARAKLLLNVRVRDQDILETIEFLISKNADLNIKDKEGKTPLDRANFTNPLVNGSLNEIIDLLRKHGGKTGEELKAEGK